MNAARIRALSIVGLLVIAAAALAFYTMGNDTQKKANYNKLCAANLVPITTKLPDEKEITLKIYNGTKTPGLAESLSERFRHFGFKVQPVDRKKDNRATTDAVAVITYGPKTVAAAQVVRAYFLMTDPSTDSNMQFSLKNTSPVVAVTIGGGYRQLGAPTEVHQAIAALGTPAAPPGTCPTDQR
jgi:hypothetical protein